MTGLLRVATAGSVDDGKSTLIGRLLHDSKNVYTDQLDAVRRVSRPHAVAPDHDADLALLTDGLRAEREQGITIDVAYRYFATQRRSFVVADTPGHVQYTRNMVTGASTADAAVVLADVRAGVVQQTRRHVAIASLLRVEHIVLAVNKMDLVDYSPSAFADVVADFGTLAAALANEFDAGDNAPRVTAIPISALHGANVVHPAPQLDWFPGPTLLRCLEELPTRRRERAGFRMPVQLVLRGRSGRRYAGTVQAGNICPGDTVIVAPAGQSATVTAIVTMDGAIAEAGLGRSVSLTLDRDLDIARGDTLAAAEQAPDIGRSVRARVCIVGAARLTVGGRYLLRCGATEVAAVISGIESELEVDQAVLRPAETLGTNDLGVVTVRTAKAVAWDTYADSRNTGSFLLIEPATGATVAAGMVEKVLEEASVR